MKIRIEIDPFTKSGKKVYEFIESLKDKNGVTYIDFNEEDYLTEKDLEEIEDCIINEMAEEYELLHTDKKNNIFPKPKRCLSRDKSVAGTNAKKRSNRIY